MGKKKDKVETKALQKELRKEVEDSSFEWGNLVTTCSMCGAKQTVAEKIRHGVQMQLMCSTNSTFNLKCDKCDCGMKLFFEETTAPEEPKTETDEVVQQEDNEG